MIGRLREIDTGGGIAIYRMDDRPLSSYTSLECRRRINTIAGLDDAEYHEYKKTLMVQLDARGLAFFNRDGLPGHKYLQQLVIPLLRDILPKLRVSSLTTQKVTEFKIVE